MNAEAAGALQRVCNDDADLMPGSAPAPAGRTPYREHSAPDQGAARNAGCGHGSSALPNR